jgi:hypothetical protein
MFLKICTGLVVVLVALAGVIALQPAEFRVVRSTVIQSSPEAVFACLNNLRQWDSWSPWIQLDPHQKVTYTGPEAGAGAAYHWVGNSQVGEGNITILASQPSSAIKMKLAFVKPFPSTADVEFELRPTGSATEVVWSMSGKNNFVSKAFCLAVGGMDKMIGPDFERGLAQLKAHFEVMAR